MKPMLFMLFIYIVKTSCDSASDDNPKVEVRAVFIDCMSDDSQSVMSENELARFQRQEIFKHNALRDCEKKLALTIKLTSVPDQELEDEFIPIEHVIEGPKKTLVRLFNPYVLRLRREKPLEAYKLRKIEEVRGVFIEESNLTKKRRTPRHAYFWEDLMSGSEDVNASGENCVRKNECLNVTSNRNKRSTNFHDLDFFNDPSSQAVNQEANPYTEELYQTPLDLRSSRENPIQDQEIDTSLGLEPTIRHSSKEKFSVDESRREGENSREPPESDRRFEEPESGKQVDYDKDKRFSDDKSKHATNSANVVKGALAQKKKERPLIIYEIKNSDVMYNLQVKLFEKLSSSGGKTVWNDVSGDIASVSSFHPEWTSDDMHVRYRAAEWIQKDDFSLPANALFLVTPAVNELNDSKESRHESYESENFVVVPMEDIVEVENSTEATSSRELRDLRKVQVRVSRAQWVDDINNFKVVRQGEDKYLTRPYRRIYRAQVDVEARADENQLIRIGSTGRIPIAVTDFTGKNRVAITTQTTNTGLAAAVYRIVTRDCTPDLNIPNEKEKPEVAVSDPIMIPPMHTRRIRMEIPLESSFTSGVCTVALMNDGDETVAIREVPIKNDDRCFCVWHCDCVCLGDDPKLMCKEMSLTMQMAAGLTKSGSHHRLVRSAKCKADIFSLDIIVIILGVSLLLLLFGFLKALLGLCCTCVGFWGLDRIIQTPRKINYYYESSIRGRAVQYDTEGFPIHPDSGRRVRQISVSTEFFLNVIYFLIWPFVTICDLLKYCVICNANCARRKTMQNSSKTYFSSHDMQSTRSQWRRRRQMDSRKWMTPEAELLSGDIWNKGLDMYPRNAPNREGSYQMLHDDQGQKEDPTCDAPKPDDTEFVLLQMQKSRDSLARSQKKFDESAPVSPKGLKIQNQIKRFSAN